MPLEAPICVVTVTEVYLNPHALARVISGVLAGAATVKLSCGDSYNLAALPNNWPKVGDSQRCSTCENKEWERLHPPLTPEQQAAIAARMPKCKACGAWIALIHMVAHSTHSFAIEIDPYTGEVKASSTHASTTDLSPEGVVQNDGYVVPKVECANGHMWSEPRLRLRAQDSMGEDWTVLDPESKL